MQNDAISSSDNCKSDPMDSQQLRQFHNALAPVLMKLQEALDKAGVHLEQEDLRKAGESLSQSHLSSHILTGRTTTKTN